MLISLFMWWSVVGPLADSFAFYNYIFGALLICSWKIISIPPANDNYQYYCGWRFALAKKPMQRLNAIKLFCANAFSAHSNAKSVREQCMRFKSIFSSFFHARLTNDDLDYFL